MSCLYRAALISVSTLIAAQAQEYTLGVGVYPGDPKQNWSPTLQPGPKEYRNLALHRPAFHSSSYDYNLTAQLVTDGIKETVMPRWIVVSTSDQGVLKKTDRELVLDNNWVTAVNLQGKSAWVQVEIAGGERVPAIDYVRIRATIHAQAPDNQEVTCTVLGSDDGRSWTEFQHWASVVPPTGQLEAEIPFAPASTKRFYRVRFDNGRPLQWQVGELGFVQLSSRGPHMQVHLGGPYDFSSAWKSGGSGEEWVYVDLGARSRFDRVALSWIRKPAEGSLQISDDAKEWRTIHALDSAEFKLAEPVEARYVRVLLTKPATSDGYILSEFEVFGWGGVVPVAKPAAAGLQLTGGAWKVERESQVNASGAILSRVGFNDSAWQPATVPGTILTSYYNAGAVPDPNFGDNQNMISDSFFYSDFWYRNEFTAPQVARGEHVWLNFKGINWKAEAYLNGEKLGDIAGAFTRAKFDVTGKLRAKNALAIRIVKNATPGSIKEKTLQVATKNGGALGADNPTFHASIGWDWIPTIRGRDTGIWGDVSFSVSGGVTVDDPFVNSALQGNEHADVTVTATLHNHEARAVSGTLHGSLGDRTFDVPVSLGPSESRTVKQTLAIENPKLWWPNGYGDPNLYDVELRFENSDTVRFKTGIRQFTYSEEGGTLRMWINGRRFIPRGGNWGFSESMLRYRGREYEIAMRYHRDMNFNMVRNWVGQIGEDEFYEAADRNGIVIMQDFWLANPWDGPDPGDGGMFMQNADDTILRIRNHPSIGLYCGRNEGYPLKPLDDSIRASLERMHPEIEYIPSSADDLLTGHGPYQAMTPEYYFRNRATTKIHSEVGMPNIVTMDSLRQMMKESDMWPLDDVWGLHDFTLTGAQGGAGWRNMIDKSYGGAKNAAEFVELSQFLDYDGYRAMFEAQSKNRMGVLLWMSHPCWPSFVWQTYDYYFDQSAGYFGSKKGSEPLHIQWNPLNDTVEVVNYSTGNATGLTAHADILNMDGSKKWEKSVTLDSAEDTVQSPIQLEFPAGLTPVHFIRLKLTRGGETVSDNFYLRGTEKYDLKAIRDLQKAEVKTSVRVEHQGTHWVLMTALENTSMQPALMVRVKVVREKSGDRILPVLHDDNYIALMPGERRTIHSEVVDADTRGERPRVVVEGFNVRD